MIKELEIVTILIILLCAMAEAGTQQTIGTRENPIPIGTAFELDNGWQITVLDVFPNANSMIKQENMFNSEPKSGNQYFLARIAVKNNGTDVDKANDYYFNAVGDSAVAYERAGVVKPDPLPETDIFPSGTAVGNICWEIKTTDADNLTMYHTHVKPYVFFSLKP